jgi:dihydroxyacetone kinase
MTRNDVKLFKSAMSLLLKATLQKGYNKVGLISGGGSGHEYVHFHVISYLFDR